MPFYDLKCKSCNHTFNIYASVSKRTKNIIKCPECGGAEHETIFNDKPNVYIKKSEVANICPNASKCGGCGGHM